MPLWWMLQLACPRQLPIRVLSAPAPDGLSCLAQASAVDNVDGIILLSAPSSAVDEVTNSTLALSAALPCRKDPYKVR